MNKKEKRLEGVLVIDGYMATIDPVNWNPPKHRRPWLMKPRDNDASVKEVRIVVNVERKELKTK